MKNESHCYDLYCGFSNKNVREYVANEVDCLVPRCQRVSVRVIIDCERYRIDEDQKDDEVVENGPTRKLYHHSSEPTFALEDVTTILVINPERLVHLLEVKELPLDLLRRLVHPIRQRQVLRLRRIVLLDF